jgi:hypothetical protein
MLDLEKFRAVQGSGDRSLLREITTKARAEIENYDRQFLESEGGAQPLAEVIAQIIDGRLDPDTPRFQFEGAAAMIADAMGEPLPVESLREARGAFCDEVDDLIAALRDVNRIGKTTLLPIGRVLERGPLLKVPLDPKMGLGTGYLTGPEVNRATRALARVDLDQPVGGKRLTWPELANDAVKEYRAWLRSASTHALGLFMHR